MRRIAVSVIGVILIGLSVVLWVNLGPLSNQFINPDNVEESYEPEERPKEAFSPEEQAVNQRHKERSQKFMSNLKGAATNSSYADGKITGSWDHVRFLAYDKHSYGFRVDGSLYDQESDVLYAISYAGHIWKINRDERGYEYTQWELINHKENFLQSYIEGLNKTEGSFRLVRSSDTRMQYSDDEGRNWIDAGGLQYTEKTFEGAVTGYNGGNRVFVAAKTSSSAIKVYVSTDDGASYTTLSPSFHPNTYQVKVFKPCFSESVFLVALNASTSKISIYECGAEDTDFNLIASPSNSFNGLSRVFGTYYGDKFHFYIAGAKTHIYYSEDKGASWQIKSSDNTGDGDIFPRTVHPTKPNVIFRGYLDVNMSTNYGTTFTNFSHLLGWDVHHMKMYQKKDQSYFHFVGKDFGCYLSDKPETKSDYIQLNNTAPIQMCYDADHSQNYPSSFTATQDRGTVGYDNSANEAHTIDVKTTDGLRVTLGNNEESVWTWMYYGSIFHQSNFAARSSSLSGINWTGNWWASPMIASPNKSEDAIYVAAGDRLTKFTYNSNKRSIIQTAHYFNFSQVTGSKVSGFGFSPINTLRWYVSTKNGDFLYSRDGGQTFEKTSYSGWKPTANDQAYNYQKNQQIIKASNISEETVYYAGIGNLFLISNDGGQTFTNHNSGLDVYRIRDFDFTEDEKFIFAACAYGGLWVYSVDSDRWYEMNDEPVPNVDFTDVEYIVNEHTINFASYGNGVLKFTIDGPDEALQYPENLRAEITDKGLIELSWDDLSNNEEGFIVERSCNGVFSPISSISSDQNVFIDTSLLIPDAYIYRVKAFNSTDESYYSNFAYIELAPQGSVSKSGWQLVSVDSEETYSAYPGMATLAFDEDENTIWHTQWYNIDPKPGHPHEIVIDMNDTLLLYGFGYLPRQDNNPNGTIGQYEFYVSMDRSNWTKEAAGTWSANNDLKDEYFASPVESRYIKLVALSEINSLVFTSCAELSIYTQLPVPQTPASPQFVQGGMLSDTQLELIWLDLSDDEDGFVIEQLEAEGFTPVFTSTEDVTSFKLQNVSRNTVYTFRVAAFNEVGQSEYSETLVINPEGVVKVEDFSNNKYPVSAFPNPFEDVLSINLDVSGVYSDWEIINVSGKVMMHGIIPGYENNQRLNVQDLEPGIYFLKVRGNMKSSSVVIVKK